jgi:MFS family permease
MTVQEAAPARPGARDYLGLFRSPLGWLLGCRFVTATAYFGSVPFLILRLTEDLQVRRATAAWLIGGVTLLSRILAMPVGLLSDRIGQMPLLAGAGLISSAALIALALDGDPWLVVLMLITYGVGSAAQFVGFNAVIPTLVDEARAPLAFALMGAMFNVGAVAGPAVAASLVGSGEYGLVLFAAGIGHAASGAMALYARRRVVARDVTAEPGAEAEPPVNRGPLTAAFLVLYAATWGLLQQLILGMAPYASSRFGSPEPAAGFFGTQALVALVAVPLAAPFTARLGPVGRYAAYAAGTVVLLLALPAFALVPGGEPLVAVGVLVVLVTASEALAVPTAGALVARLVPKRRHGTAFGTLGLAQAAGVAVGSFTAGLAFSYVDAHPGQVQVFWWVVAGVFAAPVLVAAVTGSLLSRRERWR